MMQKLIKSASNFGKSTPQQYFSAAQKGKDSQQFQKNQNKKYEPMGKVQLDNAVQKMQEKFLFKLKNQEKQGGNISNNISLAQQKEKLDSLTFNKEQIQEQKQKNAVLMKQKGEKLHANKKSSLLQNLKKVDQNGDSFNSIFKSNETSYLNKGFQQEIEKKQNSVYQMEQIQKVENTIDEYQMPDAIKQELNQHIYQQELVQEQQMMTYLGFNEFETKTEQLKTWRQNQVVENMDFTPDTMGLKEVYYPGSKKGRLPIDDMEQFGQWYKQNMPQPYKVILENFKEVHETKIRNQVAPKFLSQFVDNTPYGFNSEAEGNQSEAFVVSPPENQVYVSELNALQAPQIEDMPECDPFETAERMIFEDDAELRFQDQTEDHEIPIFPEFTKADHHYSVDLIDKWSIFRLHPIMQNSLRQFKQMAMDMQAGKQLGDHIKIPTLYAYYNTLPEQLQNHIIVKNTVRCLEQAKHDMTLQDKYLALNFACRMTMPMHPLLEEAVTEIIETEKYWVTAAEEDQVLKRETPLEQDEENKDSKISENNVDNSMVVQQDWNRPSTRKVNDIDEIIPDIPLQYYDNNDGFWDWHINEQEDIYSETELPQFRPFFKH